MTEPRLHQPRRALLFVIAFVVWALDQATKAVVVRNLPFGDEWAPVPGLQWLFAFTHTANTGAAFGLFPDASLFFVAMAFLVIGAIIFFYDRLPTHHLLVRVALGLQLGGALGNLTDRLTRGAVTDFIHFKFWPVFNIADSGIVVGVLILGYYLMREDQPQRLAPATESGPLPSSFEGSPSITRTDPSATLSEAKSSPSASRTSTADSDSTPYDTNNASDRDDTAP